jgi:Mg-chelatase subunit ChlI
MSDVDENIKTIVIKSHSKISKTVSKGLRLFSDEIENTSTLRLRIEADSNVAAKAITVVEIIKRRMALHGKQLVQSNEVREKPCLVEVPLHQPPKTHLQGEGYETPKKRTTAQLVMMLELKSS